MPARTHWTHLLLIFRNPNLRLKLLRLHYSKMQNSEKFNKMLQIAQNRKIHVESLEITSNSESMDLNTLIPLQYLDTGILQKLNFSHRVDRITDIKTILEKIVGSEQFQRNPMIECEGKIIFRYRQTLSFILKPSKVTFHLRWLAALHFAKMIKNFFQREGGGDLMQSTVLEKFHFHASDVDDFPAGTLIAKHFKRPDFFKAKGIPANIRFQKIQENQFWRIEINHRLITLEKVDHFY
ncbi:hypothetical protein CAEBREN_09567 [Caenorhabditis brenneri]|uniref:DUF38 domain-containing protein n=1 Tax=Caenorhabditis brenneri TaxID=135651 RepID=G0N306_CAEBE|nr:hypothetical protein CAEBREN_09567 [Caenorhabditis brenneri]